MRTVLKENTTVKLELTVEQYEKLQSVFDKAEKWMNLQAEVQPFILHRPSDYPVSRSTFEPMPEADVKIDWSAGLKLILEKYLIE